MTTLNQIQDAVVATIKSGLTDLKTVEAHGGRFDAGEIRRVTAQAPAAFIAVLNFRQVDDRGSNLVTLGAFVTAKDLPGNLRTKQAGALVSALASFIAGNRWGLDDAEGIPQGINGRNLYGSSVDRKGVALWAITWQQRFELDDAPDLEELNSFITYHGAIDVDPLQDGEPLAADTVTLPQE
jgi:hypothetical protein